MASLARDALAADGTEATQAFQILAELVTHAHEVILARAVLAAAERGDESLDMLGRALARAIARE